MKSSRSISSFLLRILTAGAITVLFVGCLALARWLRDQPQTKVTIHEVEIATPVPPPPLPLPVEIEPEETQAAPESPALTQELPQLEIPINSSIPPLDTTLDPTVDLAMAKADFAVDSPAEPGPAPTKALSKSSAPKIAVKPPARTTFSSGELDGMPRLTNRPSATFPPSMQRKGIKQGKVVLEVSISPGGRCRVRRVVSSTHPDFTKMAKSFATRARFTTPKKNGRAVTAIYRWPLVLKP